jgi:hypothetical protein
VFATVSLIFESRDKKDPTFNSYTPLWAFLALYGNIRLGWVEVTDDDETVDYYDTDTIYDRIKFNC